MRTDTGPRRRAPALAGLLAAAFLLDGCAYSMIADGALREEALADVTARAIAARGIAAGGPVPARVIARDEIPDIVHRLVAPEWTPAEIADYQEGLEAVGVWPPDRDLLEEFVALSREQVLGLYIPPEGALYVVEDAVRPFSMRVASRMTGRDLYLEAVLAHEIVHWLQHRSYPWLLEEDNVWKRQDDFTLAVQTAVEGDAMRYGLAAFLDGRAALPHPDRFAESAGEAPESDAPALLRLTLLLPYVAGYRLSYEEGHALLDAPPASSEQALHPARRREPFTVADLAGARAALPAGCRPLDTNTLGEVGISVLFRDLAAEPREAAWQGWDGDRYVAARCGERRELAWWTSWDDDDDAREFAAAYAEIAEAARARASFEAPAAVWRVGATVVVSTPAFGDPSAWVDALRTARVATGPALRAFFDAPYAHPDAPRP